MKFIKSNNKLQIQLKLLKSNIKCQMQLKASHFLVLKKSLPCTLVAPPDSETSAAVDDFLGRLFLSRFAFQCAWKASEIIFPSVSTCAPVTSPFGGNHVIV